MKYADKFKDPRWQKKRLEVLEFAGFECQNCGNSERQLHVHHKFYKKDSEPWEYDEIDFFVFCSKCHTDWHEAKKELDYYIGDCCSVETLRRVIGYILPQRTSDTFQSEIDSDFDKLTGMSDYFRTDIRVVQKIDADAKGEHCPISLSDTLWLQQQGH